MKKIILYIFILLISGTLISCKSGFADIPPKTDGVTVESKNEEGIETTPVETKSEGPIRLSPEERAKLYKLVEFELPEEDYRDVIVEYMRKCASIEWVAAEDFGMKQDNGDWNVDLFYQKGTAYQGLPYTSYAANYDYFADLIVDGKYAPKDTDWNKAPGLNCFSAIFVAFQQFESTEESPIDWIPGQKNFRCDIVGDYKTPDLPKTTKVVCELNGKDVMFEAYSQLKKGDIILKLNNSSTGNMHCRVVTEDASLVKTAAGKIIPSRSYVKTIEQTNAFDRSRSDGVKTNWYVDHKYAFDNLFDSNYVPFTLKSYNKSLEEMEVPYIALDSEITSGVLEKKLFTSTVKSNFPIRFVRAEVFDKSGKVIVTQEKGDSLKTYKLPLRNHFVSIFDKLESGEYTFVLKAGISAGDAELARVDFTYNK